MPACFMVDSAWDAWTEGGSENVGAMWWWRHEDNDPRNISPRPQPHLAVMTPAGICCLDCPASEPDPPGSYWARTGEPPDVTVTPSLDVARGSPDHWHDFLTAGILTP